MGYNTDAYLVTCLTNMHAGSGGATYGVIDNLVQRDSITNMPTIHSSSLKGALREYFKDLWKSNEDADKLNYIFGSDSSRSVQTKDSIGHYKFFPADLLVLPVRSNKKPFFRATANMLIDTINEKAKVFLKKDLIKGSYNVNTPTIKEGNGIVLEDWSANVDQKFIPDVNLGDNVAGFDDDTFKKLANKLPVIARNQLDNGESKNLWYEEILPRESKLVFFVAKDEKYSKEFDDKFKNAIIQIGANASIGYGYVTITKIGNDE
jgi:CRISPR-associated protein Cmr4